MSGKLKLLPVIILFVVGIATAANAGEAIIEHGNGIFGSDGFRDTLNPEIVVQPDSFYVVIKPDTVLHFQMSILNEGNDTLDFNIFRTPQSAVGKPGNGKSVEGSTLTSDMNSYIPGEAFDYTFSLYNGSPDNEWLDTLIIHFPQGVSVNYATNFTGGTLGPLVFDGTTGNGVTVSWNDENGGNGNILPGETALALINIGFDEALDDTLYIPYEISGDVYGAPPHTVYDTLVLQPENVWLIAEPDTGNVPPGGEQVVDLYFNSGGIPIGYYDKMFYIQTNDTSDLVVNVPVSFIVFPYNITQTIDIPAGWSGISACVLPFHPEMEQLFDTLSNNVEVLRNQTGLFWPGQQINTIGDWDTFEGYVINAKEPFQLSIPGLFEVSQTLFLTQGWHIMPVLTTQVASTFVVFRDIEDYIDVVMEVSGDKVYWPSQNIYTLTHLEPGKAYYIRVLQDCSIHFPSPVK